MELGKIPHSQLQKLLEMIPQKRKKMILIGPQVGMDTALVKLKKSTYSFTMDPITFLSEDAVHYLINVNVNDLVVSGAQPQFMLLTILLPRGTNEEFLEEFFRILKSYLDKFKIDLLGGHSEITDGVTRPIFIASLFGNVKCNHLKPERVKKGDILLQIKRVPIEGLSILARELPDKLIKFFPQEKIEELKNFIYEPGISVYEPAKLLWKYKGVKFMHDPTEGGILTAIYEMTLSTKLGCLVDTTNILVYDEAIILAEKMNLNPYGLISSGSLLAALDEKYIDDITKQLKKRNYEYAVIGEFTDKFEEIRDMKTLKPLPVFPKDELTKII